jgi:hypothetical protein
MAVSVLVTTTGTPGTVTFPDLGLKTLTHPVVAEEFIGQFTASELSESEDFQAAIDGGEITVTLDGDAITDARFIEEGIQDATQVPYDNTISGLTATDVKAALDEIAADVGTDPNLSEVLAVGNTTGANDIIVTHGQGIFGADDANAGNGGNLSIAAGDSTTGNNNGGDLTLTAGAGDGTGTDGSVIIGATDTTSVDLGDGTNDVTIHSLIYPTADGTDGQVLTTDGAGNLAFEDVTVPVSTDTFMLGASRKSNSTSNTYLFGYNDVPTNEVGYVLPFDCTLIAMTAATIDAETWSGEIHTSLSLVAGALVSIAAATSGTATMSINFNAGDIIQFYCNGTGISKPVVNAFFRRR